MEEAAEMVKVVPSARVGERAPALGRLGTTQVVIVRWQGRVRVYRNACPHAGAPLSGGRVESGRLVCPRHGWEFDLSSCPMHPLYALRGFEAEERDGWIWARPDTSEIW
jgi:phenylpropionate dioxygenase-like ring-hydroxylating dioxygenase large terminal subunit